MSAKKSRSQKPGKKTDVKGDDRNLVPATESDVEPLFEEKLLEFWQNNKGLVVFAIVAVVVGVGAIEVMKLLRVQEVEKMQQIYLNSGDDLMAFADTFATEPLGGKTYLIEADKYYDAGAYELAADAYLKAAQALITGPVASRARIGAGMSNLKSGQRDEGITMLTLVLDDQEQFDALRAEAAYHLAEHALANGQTASAREYLNVIREFEYPSIWTNKALDLGAIIEDKSAGPAEEVTTDEDPVEEASVSEDPVVEDPGSEASVGKDSAVEDSGTESPE